MKTYYFFFAFAFIVCSCGSGDTKSQEKNAVYDEITGEIIDEGENYSENQKPEENFWQPIVMHEVKDQKGVVWASYPLPENWTLNNPEFVAAGPDNIRVRSFPLQNFTKNLDPSMDYIYSQMPQRGMPDIAQLIQEDVYPWTQQNGYTILKHYELPAVGKMDAWYSDQLYKAMPSQQVVKAFGIDIKDKNGNPALMILHLSNTRSTGLEMWNYRVEMLESDPNAYELAKKQYIFALENVRYNLEPIMDYNKQEMQRVGQNWAAFNKRMADNQRAFEASQRAHINKTNAVNDAIMAGWRSSNEVSDRMQEQRVDAIYERQTVQNPETGEITKIDNGYGYNRYWMNSNGDYIATEYQNYDPNTDANMNRTNWQELNKVK